MGQKYTILQHITEPFYVVNCPVLMLSHALTKDNQNNSIFIQCKFENLGKKAIKAMSVQVKCFDISNMPLFNVDKFSYLDISIKRHQIFGDKVPITLPNNKTRNFFIVPLKILFDDNSIWENNSLYPFQSVEIKKPLISELGELEEEYRRELNEICMQSQKHHYLPIHKGKYVICGCGKVFLDSEDTCPLCDIEIKSLFNLMDINKLQSNLEQFKKSETQKQEQEFLHSKKQKRVKTNIIITFTLFCLLFVGLSLGRRVFISYNYSNALENAPKYKDVISVGDFYTLGTKNDGTVVATGYNEDGQCNVQEWENVLSVFATRNYAMGLKKDSTVYASGEFTGLNGLEESDHQEMLHWTNITTLSVQTDSVAGLKENGSIVECGMSWSEKDIEKWNDIVDVFVGNKCIIGLNSDGTIETTKYSM